jgi:geranylgeranylglycerol-phosphate geranylgeranyltransferase
MGSGYHRTGEVIRAYAVLPHAVPIIAVLTATAAFASVARGGWPGTADIVTLLLAMLGGQLAVGAVNEIVDIELDRVAKPHKPIPAGLVSERGARRMAWCGLALMVAGSLRFSLEAFALCALGTGLGIAYSLWFKRTPWSWVPYVLAIPLMPIWVWTALDEAPLSMLALYPIAIPALVALQLAQSIPDIDGDGRTGVRTLAVVLGERRAIVACWGSIAVSTVIAAFTAGVVAERPGWVWLACAMSWVPILLGASLWRRDARTGRERCFPLVAAAVVVLGVGWTMATV